MQRRWRSLLRRGEDLRALTAPQRHRVRISAKKVRYGAEFFTGLFPDPVGTPPSEFAIVLGTLQDDLGALNDIHTFGVLLESLGAQPPVTDEDALVSAAVETMRQVAGMTPFWDEGMDH